ncbi:L-fuculose-phosphate aldolase [Pseudonocardia kunmingensis]|uniref:L-fuculose-phosphate aldolase n=2 Tax=Pseudonocardia kunmingensis TaxID=630975 RepID=A0A543DQ77_9PSEU|nr:class II aldolase/adducin family protein [Pseudonocardia kunmingensis]TQM11464.1 L-fuculose-phosphate aldolase [Pseudonocardia kunmingensis]
MSDDPREQVRLGCQVLDLLGQSDLVWGHVSVRDPGGRGTWIKARGLGFDEVTASDVVLVDRDGTILEGDGGLHLEYPIHTEVLAARPDVSAVVHTHPQAAVAFGATDLELRPIGHEGALFSPPGPPRFTGTSDLINTSELGAAVAASLGNHNAVLLVNHGIVTAGRDLPAAVLGAVFLEKACRLQLDAAATGRPLRWSTDEEAVAKRESFGGPGQMASVWQYLLRRVQTRVEARTPTV